MAKAGTDRLKLNPPLGLMPALQYLLPAQLEIDADYQRSLDTSSSQSLIRKIAQFWNWDLCQPLVVSRRDDGRLFVIDGQHRLAAARLRGDIAQLPAVVVQYASAADEAASFVNLNQLRKPLNRLDLFKAALVSEDSEATAIAAAIADAGLTIAPHTNYASWKSGMVSNLGGIQAAWRADPAAAALALRVLAGAYGEQVLRYAGTIYPGIVAVCSDELTAAGRFAEARFERFQTMLAIRSQDDWRREIAAKKAEQPDLKYSRASAVAIRNAWARASADLQPVKPAAVKQADPVAFPGKRWCDQCEIQVTAAEAASCRSRFCGFRAVAA